MFYLTIAWLILVASSLFLLGALAYRLSYQYQEDVVIAAMFRCRVRVLTNNKTLLVAATWIAAFVYIIG